MVLGFKKQFKEPILAGTKRHSIREDKTNRWKAGNSIQMATGVRTKNYTCFKNELCISTQKIEIKYVKTFKYPDVFIDGVRISYLFAGTLALNDGFASADSFFGWFNKDFTGKIIHWTDLRY